MAGDTSIVSVWMQLDTTNISFKCSNSNNKIKTVDKFTVPVSNKTIQVPEKPYCNFFSDPQEPYLFASPDTARMKEQINYRY